MNVISEELNRIKCLFNYKPGSVISEQENSSENKYSMQNTVILRIKRSQQGGVKIFKGLVFTKKGNDIITNRTQINSYNDFYEYHGQIQYFCNTKTFKIVNSTYIVIEKQEFVNSSLSKNLDNKLCNTSNNNQVINEPMSADTTSKEAIQPTEPTHTYPNDKNYKYAKDNAGNWWGLNIINNKWFNLIDYPESIEKLNTGAVEI